MHVQNKRTENTRRMRSLLFVIGYHSRGILLQIAYKKMKQMKNPDGYFEDETALDRPIHRGP
jgi:hypothetical protein